MCALYLSVGTVFSALHDHSDDGLHGEQQCAACAWQHVSVDVPTAAPMVRAPEVVPVGNEGISIFFNEVTLGIHPSRGPPSFSQ